MTKQMFLQSILREFYVLMHKLVNDNYDEHRFSFDGVDRSQSFDLGGHSAYFQIFINSWEAFFNTYLLLKDSESRELFRRLILYRLLGHLHVRIKEDVTAQTEKNGMEQDSRFACHQSDLTVAEMFGPMIHFEKIPFEGNEVKLDCWAGAPYCLEKKQYFLERDHIHIRPEAGDFCIDAGACFGDTAITFALAAGESGKVWSFEPLPSYIAVCRHNFEQNNLEERISIVPYAISAETSNLDKTINNDGGGSPGFSIAGIEDQLPLISIDDFVRDRNISRIDFIKMDIEGAELAALKGANDTISKFRPKMAISLYHKPDDFITIPQYISSIYPDYDFYLDHYTIHAEETVLYCKSRQNNQ